MMKNIKRMTLILLCVFFISSVFAQSDNGRGRHKQLYAVPVSGEVTIDGNLEDWDLSGQIEMFVVQATRGTQSAKFALMYDDEALYLSGDVNDPSPMMNRHNPKTNADSAWDADACQFRLTIDSSVGYPISESSFKYKGKNAPQDIRTDILHLLLWYYTDDKEANLQMSTGMTYKCPREEWGPFGLIPTELFEGKYSKRIDETGYTFEYRIPWSTLGAKKPLKGDDIVAGTVQFLWSRPDGLKTAGGSSWAYDVQGKSGFGFQNTECWGKIIFSKTGNVPSELVLEGVPPEQPMPLEFKYDLPEDSECTVQLFNESNEVVRIITAQQERLGGTNSERWNGLDSSGKLLPAGKYNWKGIYHKPIKAKYRFSAHNSGVPAYPTDNNRGGWGGDHGSPQTVCSLSDGMLLAWSSSEFGWGIIRTDLNGRKLWGSNYSATYLATDGKLIYLAGGHGFQKSNEIQLLDIKDARPAALSDGTVFISAPSGGNETNNVVTGLAYDEGKLYVSYGWRNMLGVFSTKNGELIEKLQVENPGRLVVAKDNSLLVISNNEVVKVSDGKCISFIKTNLDNPQSITVDKDGTIYVANRGKLQNVSVFDNEGKYIRSVGRHGGRPAIGKYDATGMYEAGGIDLDANGYLWVAETKDGPKRISVWDTKKSTNLKEFFGGSSYFGYGFIDSDRPDEIYAHNVIWGIDWRNYKVKPLTIVWRQTNPDMMPEPGPEAYQNYPRMITADNGHQYMWGANRKTLSILLIRNGDVFKPLSAFIYVGDRHGRYYHKTGIDIIDKNEGLFPKGYYFWQDGNDDQMVQTDEITVLDSKEFYKVKIAWVDSDLGICLNKGHMLYPVSVKENGQPVYDITKAKKTFINDSDFSGADLVKGSDGEIYSYGKSQLIGWDANGNKRFVYPGIVNWQNALNMPVVKPGRLHGTTGGMGVAGDFFAHQTYFGPNHIFRRDGMYVAAILKDGRTGGRGPYEGQPEGQNGSFVELNIDGTNRVFAIGGGQDSRVWEVLNLDTIKDLPGGVYEHTPAMVAKAEAAQKAYKEAMNGEKKLLIVRGEKALDVAKPVRRELEGDREFEVCAAYDAENLYFKFDVTAPEQLENGQSDPKIIFRGGNLLDIQFGTDPKADSNRKTAVPGDFRILVTRKDNKPFAVLFTPKVKGFNGEAIILKSPTGTESFDSIEVLDDISMKYRKNNKGFSVTLTIPLKQLGISLKAGQKFKYDLGYIFGNKGGTRTAIRAYINNNSFSANVIDDIPHESRLEPAEWGEATVE